MPETNLVLTATDKASGPSAEANQKIRDQITQTAAASRAAAEQEDADLRLVLAQWNLLPEAVAASGAAHEVAAEAAVSSASLQVEAAGQVIAAQASISEAVAARAEASIAAETTVQESVSRTASVVGEAAASEAAAVAGAAGAMAVGAEAAAAGQGRLGAANRKVVAETPELTAAYARAEAAVAHFGEAAEQGSLRIAKPATAATVALRDLEAEIVRLKAAGVPIPADMEAALARLTAQVEQYTVRAGQVAKIHKEVELSLKASAVAAGQFEGTIHGAGGILALVNPKLGEMVGQLTALGLSGFVAWQGVELMVKGFERASRIIQDEYVKSLVEADQEARIASGETGKLAENLRNVLGPSAASAQSSLASLVAEEEHHEAVLRHNAEEAAKRAASIVVDRRKLLDDTRKVMAEVEDAEKRATDRTQGAAADTRRALESIDAALGAVHRSSQELKTTGEDTRTVGERFKEAAAKAGGLKENLVALTEPLGFLRKGAEEYDETMHRADSTTVETTRHFVQFGKDAPPELVKVRNELAAVVEKGGDYGAAVRRATDELKTYFWELKRQGQEAPAVMVEFKHQLESISAVARLPPEEATKLLKDLDTQIKAYTDSLQPVPRQLQEVRAEVARWAEANKAAALSEDELLKRIGVEAPAKINLSIDKLREYSSVIALAGTATREQAARIIKEIDSVRAAINLLPADSRVLMKGELDDLNKLEQAYKASAEAALQAFGVKTPEALRESVASLSGLVSAFGGLSNVTGQQGEMVTKDIAKIRKEIESLPPAERAAVADLVSTLDQWDEALAKSSAMALKTFGVETPDAIRHSARELHGLVEAYGPLGTVSKEAAEKVASESKKILEQIALLPAAQRAALADQAASIRSIEALYGEYAQRVKASVVDIAASLKALQADFKPILDLMVRLRQEQDAMKASSQGQSANTLEGISKQIQALRDLPSLTVDQSNQLSDLILKQEQARSGAVSVTRSMQGYPESSKPVVASAKDINSAIAGLSNTLHEHRDQWGALSTDQQEAVTSIVSNLRQIGDSGRASAEDIGSAMQGVRNVFAEAGQDTRLFDTALASARGQATDFRQSMSDLSGGADQIASSFDAAGRKIEDALSSGRSALDQARGPSATKDEVKKVNEELKTGQDEAKKSVASVNQLLTMQRDLAKELLDLFTQLKACMASASLGAAAGSS